MDLEGRIAELEAEIVAKDVVISAQNVRIAEQDARIAEQEARIEALNGYGRSRRDREQDIARWMAVREDNNDVAGGRGDRDVP